MSQIPPQKSTQESRSRSETGCSSTSSCYLQRKQTKNPLATNYRPNAPRSTGNPVRQRVLSAKLLKLRSLQNQLNDANYHLAELTRENQALKTLQRRQDKALTKYEGTSAELPKILESYESEIRVLNEKNKQLKKTVKELNEQIKHKNDEINNHQIKLKHYENLDRDKHLLEREKLLESIDDYKMKLQRADEHIVILTRKLMLETKSCKQKLNVEISKHKQSQRELDRQREEIGRLTKQLHDKDKTRYFNNGRLRHQQSQSMVALNGTKSETDSNPDMVKSAIKLEPIRNVNQEKLISRPNSSIKLEKIVRDSPRIDDRIEQLTKHIEQKTELDQQLTDTYLNALDSLKTCNNAIEVQRKEYEITQNETENILESVRRVDEMEQKLKNSQILTPNSATAATTVTEDVDLVTKIFEEELQFQTKYKSLSNKRKEPSVGLEERRKLLETLRAIDNGECSFEAFDNTRGFREKLVDVSESD